MTRQQILIATDDARIAALEAKLDAILRQLQAVQMAPRPEWLTVAEYAAQTGRSTKTVRNWVREGKVETRRDGTVLMIKAT